MSADPSDISRRAASSTSSSAAALPTLAAIEVELLKQLRSLAFGSIEVVVHDTRIVQIERREKVRFDAPAKVLR